MSIDFTKRQVVETCPDQIQIEIRSNVSGMTVVVVGELDLVTAPQLLEAVADCQGPVTYDLAGVTFLDAAGLRALLASGKVTIVNPSGCVERVLQILQLDKLVISGSGLSKESDTQRVDMAEEFVGEGEWVVITLDGEIDLARADELAAILVEQWNPTQNLLIDLVRVTFMDSTGLRWLLNTQGTLLDVGRELRLLIPEAGHLERLLGRTGMTSSFTIYRNLDKALERISAGDVLGVLDSPKSDEFGPPDG